MTKTKKLNTAVNTEIDQALAAINFSDFKAIDKPPASRLALKLAIAASLLLTVGGLSWYFFIRKNSLADWLPASTSFYASLALPEDHRRYSSLLFWQRDNKPNATVASLYPRLDLISWPGASWAEKILPLLSDRIELALIPGAAATNNDDVGSGVLVMRSILKDRDSWLRLLNVEPGYAGEIRTLDAAVSGAWAGLTKNPNKIAWRILGNDLYLADDEGILRDLFSKKADLLKVKSGLATLYLGDKDVLDINNPYLKPLGATLALPATLVIKQTAKSLNFTVETAREAEIKNIQDSSLAWKLWHYDTAFYAQDAKAAYQNLGARLPPDILEILKGFYNLDLSALLTEIGPREIFLTVSGNDWLFNIANKNKESNDPANAGATVLKKVGAAMFSVAHSKAVERTLSDGSTMVELRAESQGLEWQAEPWSYAGNSVDLSSLRGAGEPNGYYVGAVPGVGQILTTSLSLLNEYVQIQPLATDCFAPEAAVMGASWPIKQLIFKKIILAVSSDNKMAGCALLTD